MISQIRHSATDAGVSLDITTLQARLIFIITRFTYCWKVISPACTANNEVSASRLTLATDDPMW